MGSQKHFEYHLVAKKMGIPNIILTGIEKQVKLDHPEDDEEMYACHVLLRIKAIAEEFDGDWSKCDIEGGGLKSGRGKISRVDFNSGFS